MKESITLKERNLAIVLLDIIGSTAFVQKVGAKKAAVWLQYHDRLARSLIYKYNGREIDRSDGFLLSFETIIDAVNFSLHYQEVIPKKIHLNTRIGIHWGPIIEVEQEELFVGVGAKRIELEGISKNIAARTMSLSGPGQVLLTKEAMTIARRKGRNMHTPKETRYACVGMYKFKGVREPQEIYAVGVDFNSLQPPKGSEKVQRLGGPKYIRKKARDRKFFDWVKWIFWRAGFIATLFWISIFLQISFSPSGRTLLGLPYHMPKYDAFVESVSDNYKKIKVKVGIDKENKK